MNIPTSNVIVGFSKDAMNRLFAEGATFTSLIKGLNKEGDVLLFNHDSNPNFIDFKHDMNQTQGGNVMTLRLIDPNREFEKRFITDNTVLAGGGYHLDNTNKFKNPLTEIREHQHETKLKEANSQEYAFKFRKAYQEAKGQKYIYVAYGMGENLDLWSGPHITVLKGADMQVKGEKKLTIQLAATALPLDLGDRRGLYNEEVNINLHGLDVEVNARSDNFDFLNIAEPDPVYAAPAAKQIKSSEFTNRISEFEAEFAGAIAASDFNILGPVIKNVDMHMVVTDVLRRYISIATGNHNVIVLLPDLNLVCRNTILNWVDHYKLFPNGEPSIPNPETITSAKLNNREGYYSEEGFPGRFYIVVKKILSDFGLSFDSEEKDLIKTAYSFPALQFLEDQDKQPTIADRQKAYFNSRRFFANKTST
jgi:hypothetical protein